jgi:hypothetical protein
MPVVTRPSCDSGDVTGVGTPSIDAIALGCQACGSAWPCEQRGISSRCGSDDTEDAPEDPAGGTWAYIDREVCRCRKGNNIGRHSRTPRPYERPTKPGTESM